MVDQVDLRMRSQEYLREHPELKEMMLQFVSELLVQKPFDTVDFAARFFTDDGLSNRLSGSLMNPSPPPSTPSSQQQPKL